MRVVLGPLPAAAVRAWVENALVALSLAEQGGPRFPFRAPPESLAPAFDYLGQWLTITKQSDVFEWEGEIEAPLALQLVRYWHNISRVMLELADHEEVERLDPIAEEFADPLLRALLDGLVVAGVLDGEVARRMWREWPRLRETAVDLPAWGG